MFLFTNSFNFFNNNFSILVIHDVLLQNGFFYVRPHYSEARNFVDENH